MHQIVCHSQTPLGDAPLDPLAGLGGGAPGKGKEEEREKRREGRESQNALIQSWQA